MDVSPARGGNISFSIVNETAVPDIYPRSYNVFDSAYVLLEALPAKGYAFSRWEGDAAGIKESSAALTMDSHKKVTAVFIEKPFKWGLVAAGAAGLAILGLAAGILIRRRVR